MSPPSGTTHFSSAEDCQEAFYRAMREGDSEQMRRTWLVSPGTTCIHPGAIPLIGYDAVIRSWTAILDSGNGIRVNYEPRSRFAVDRLVIHVGLEVIRVPNDGTVLVSVTNVYELTGEGWKMRLHHGAPVHGKAPVARAMH
ncbi:nuclear transport factor 2 family protein [Thioalkalivibrio sp. XN279]|uniref:nuclear transport factor 2 family protein n=1 Tax=Thioalkalivibrio sp. XN279 TaxID=2714953 RepID=UPI001409B615|nr:nuclear transport factor 2 family protein [Thioalkalivibrio sp. XN279]NHA13563.1 nuclear transport factor 2 family protein [Thioalkalivibrio sp. XN279]